jgi:hypothetical protein
VLDRPYLSIILGSILSLPAFPVQLCNQPELCRRLDYLGFESLAD